MQATKEQILIKNIVFGFGLSIFKFRKILIVFFCLFLYLKNN